MAIVEEDIARVRAATDFVAVASEHIALKKVGRRWTGLCPFHAEKSPSFSVNAEEGLYYCFGCQAKGDVITFVREIEHVDFVEAVEKLAGRANIALRYDDGAGQKDRSRKKELTAALEKAVEWYHERLLTSADAAAARSYLRSRGYDGEVVRQFRLGWAPDDWDALSKALKLPTDILRDSGLGFVNKAGRQQDAFRARIMFPIFDSSGNAVAFGGRVMPNGDGPKYKNSPETPVYSKRRTLYGLNWAKNAVVEQNEVVVCEGYTDVIGFVRSGVPVAVATCGTALADEHFRMLKNFTRRVVLAYDADAAGQAAAERFYTWERQYEIDIAVALLPKGSDPGELARKNPEALKAAVKDAQPFLKFRLDRVLDAGQFGTPEGRARAAEKAMAVINEHPNELVRDQYVMTVADRTRIDPDRLRSLRPQKGGDNGGEARAQRPIRSREAIPGPELELLRFAIHHPEELATQLPDIESATVLLTDELAIAAYRALAGSGTLHEAVERAGPEDSALLQRLAVEEPSDPESDVIGRLAHEAANRAIAEINTAALAQTIDLADLSSTMGWVRVTQEAAREGDTEAVAQLVAWITERSRTTRAPADTDRVSA